MWAIAVFMPQFTYDYAGRFIVAVFVAAFGIFIEAISVGAFIKARTTVNPINLSKSSELVTDGLYKFTRNPMYLGMLCLLLGWVLFLGNLVSLLGVFGFAMVMNAIQIKPEEAALEKIFGEDYRVYKTRVRRWI
jgi:protein-S-isoprenylcysteine O-methyltransferase Ste14